MSLSFVSKTIQTAREDGGYEEKPVDEAAANASARSSNYSSKPLFEQLRDQREKDEAEKEEFQQALKRAATGVLDEEDCAHLESLQQQKIEQEERIQQQTQLELEAFRAAQADRQVTDVTSRQGREEEEELVSPRKVVAEETSVKAQGSRYVAPIVAKKRRRKAAG